MEQRLFDPLLHDVPLPLAAVYYPLGFALRVVTNSTEVQAAARESWGQYRPEFERPPMEVRVVVRAEGPLAAEPAFLSQAHMVSVVSDRDNFACADFRELFAYAFVSERTVADHSWFRWFFLEPLVYFMLAQQYTVPIHAACVARNGSGILLSGVSGAGKSTLAFACARSGWTYIADDATSLLQESEDRLAIGKPHLARVRDDAPQLFPELAGYATRARPNGKLSIEIPMEEFPHIRTALYCPIGSMVLLDRGPGRPGLERISMAETGGVLLSDMPSYGTEVRLRHERTVGRLAGLPVYRLRYERLRDAIELLTTIEPEEPLRYDS